MFHRKLRPALLLTILMAMSELTSTQIAELFLEQNDAWQEGRPPRRREPSALTIWEDWICNDPERAWPVFTTILERRGDDATLEMLWYRLRLLLYRHFERYRERSVALFARYDRLRRIAGPQALNPKTYDTEIDEEELVDAYLRMTTSQKAHSLLSSRIKVAPVSALPLVMEIIHRGAARGWESSDLLSPLRQLLASGGDRVIKGVVEVAGHSAPLRRCLWRLGRHRRHPRLEGIIPNEILETIAPVIDDRVWEQIEEATGTTTDYTEESDDAVEPIQQLDAEENLLEGWFDYEDNFWAFDAMLSLVKDQPLVAWPIVVRLLESAPDDEAIFALAAGPLEDLIRDHSEMIWPLVVATAPSSPRLRRGLQGVWVFESDDVFVNFKRLMADLNLKSE